LEAAAHISRNLKSIAKFPSLDHAVVTNQPLDARCIVDLQAEDGPTPLYLTALEGRAVVSMVVHNVFPRIS
jgi:hypothetical protein